MEAHGGYFIRLESFSGLDLISLARQALMLDGQGDEASGLHVTVNARRKLVRLAYDGPFAWGRGGAHWYEEHHALARLLSSRTRAAVHAYVYDPDAFEQVVAYGNGREVGGERLEYSAVELPGELDDFDEAAFEKLRSRWPLGHLAYVIGITRRDLLSMPRAAGQLLSLEDPESPVGLDTLLPHAHVRAAS